ncbi:hypothetical protein KUCAC02_012331 [Chaenocephalus aceratus]|uniref:Uncharacterized protein n=1 Tax=Chaenocephalus aceratus TaxID=36190 RepID=A0ACB9XBW9_CHAAC|nr:hypothetical protein KUCAC02_012331 [Chaenocephalus aceratus]
MDRWKDSKIQLYQTEAEGSENELVLQTDVWAEQRALRDMVVEQKGELRHLASRVTAAESLVDALEKENTAIEARMTAAESLAEELQMENDAQATELAVAQQELSSLQIRLTVSEERVEELEKQQEGQEMDIQELQNTNIVRKLAFSASLLTSGQGNTEKEDAPLLHKNVFTVTSGDHNYGSNDAEDNVSNGVVLQLEVGDVVSVQLRGKVWDDHYHRTTFSGFLLFPL